MECMLFKTGAICSTKGQWLQIKRTRVPAQISRGDQISPVAFGRVNEGIIVPIGTIREGVSAIT
jgi:hypothetical protein